MRHLVRAAENVVNIYISTNCCSFYLTLKIAKRNLNTLNDEEESNNSQEEEKECLEIFEKRSEPKFPTMNHYCRFCGRKKMDDTDVDEDKCFLLSLLPSFRQFNDEQKFLAGMEILNLCDTSNYKKIWIGTHLASYLPFQTQFRSKLIAFSHQSTISTTSNFYAEFRNSLLVLVQLHSRTSKTTNLHNCPPSVSYQSQPYLQ